METATLVHNGSAYIAEPAYITITRLGPDEHNVWSFSLDVVNNDNTQCATVGGYTVLNSHGMALIKDVTDTVGSHTWEGLLGMPLLVLASPENPDLPVGIASTNCERVLIFIETLARLVGERPHN